MQCAGEVNTEMSNRLKCTRDILRWSPTSAGESKAIDRNLKRSGRSNHNRPYSDSYKGLSA